MQITRLIQCPVCNTKFMENTPGGCPKCNGKMTATVRSLNEPADSKESVAIPLQPSPRNVSQSIDAVCGWLICVNGAGRGMYYRILKEKNLISDEKNNFVTVHYDFTRSEGVSSMILFDDIANDFWLLNCCGHNIVRINGRLLLNATKLNKDDILIIGKTKFVFLPFCGESFQWKNK